MLLKALPLATWCTNKTQGEATDQEEREGAEGPGLNLLMITGRPCAYCFLDEDVPGGRLEKSTGGALNL